MCYETKYSDEKSTELDKVDKVIKMVGLTLQLKTLIPILFMRNILTFYNKWD